MTQAQKSQQIQETRNSVKVRAPHSSHARPASLLYRDVGANFPWRLMHKEKPLNSLTYTFGTVPVLASGFLSLGSQSMEESFHLLLPSRELTLLPAKSNFSSLPQTLFWVSTHWNVKFELFWLDTEVPRGCLVFWWSAIIEGKKHPWCKHSRLWMQNSSSVEIPWLLEMCSSHRLCCQ